MFPFFHVDCRTSLGGGLVFLLYALVLKANCTSKNSTSEKVDSIEPLEADYQRSKGARKCCLEDEWLHYTSEDKVLCAKLPPSIGHIASKSSWFASFSEFGIVDRRFCRASDTIEVWTKWNAQDNLYHWANKSVFNVVTRTYHHIACSDYINLQDHYSDTVDYESAENFKQLEAEVAGALLCSIPVEDFRDRVRNFLSLYGMGASTCFLAVTFYLHVSTPELRRKVYDKCFLCQLASFIVAFVFTIWRQQLQQEEEPIAFCAFVAFMNQYWLLSAFTWLTILCIDLWRAISARKCDHSNKKKFIIQCVFAWGFPLLMFFATLWATGLRDDLFFKVDFLQGFCWFQLNDENSFFKQPEFIFFYSYISLSLLVNVCLFIRITSIIISNDYCWRKNADSRKHEANKNRFLMYLKLFSAMGLTWLLEIISYYFDSKDNRWFLLILDIQGNISQGILIFAVSICNKRVKEILKNRFFSNHRESTKSWSCVSRNGDLEKRANALSAKVSVISFRSTKTDIMSQI